MITPKNITFINDVTPTVCATSDKIKSSYFNMRQEYPIMLNFGIPRTSQSQETCTMKGLGRVFQEIPVHNCIVGMLLSCSMYPRT